jgi:hypothetical protein
MGLLRCKIGVWLFLKGRVWTADRLAKRELPHIEYCVFCNSIAESASHVSIGCAVVNIIWGAILNWAVFHQVVPSMDKPVCSWSESARSNIPRANKSRLDSLVMLTTWMIWRERNGRVFENFSTPIQTFIAQIKEEAKLWALASAGHFTPLLA